MEATSTSWAWPWWTVMVLINIGNLIIAARVYAKSVKSQIPSNSQYLRRMRIMGLIFTLVGAYRSVFVSRYTAQLAWFDTVLNSALLIRSFAIFAELSFAGLIAFSMLQLNRDVPAQTQSQNKLWRFLMTKSPYVLIGCLFLAQFFATSGVITKSQTAFAIEETLWSLGFLSILPLAIVQLRRVFTITDDDNKASLKMLRWSAVIIAVWCVVYWSYGVFYHVPIECWGAAANQLRTGLPAIKAGPNALRDAFLIVHESKAYADWGFGFLFWHSAYFSICVWIAIFLMQAPRRRTSAL